MEQTYQRQTAFKTNIDSLNKGIFVKKEGWESSYLMTEYGDFSRINLICVVVNKDGPTISLDDGTGRINARIFDNSDKLNSINVGQVYLIIGRPREYNNSKYITIEIIKEINIKWLNYRKKELELIKKIRVIDELIEKENVEEENSGMFFGQKDKLSKLIKELDDGSGVNIDDIIKISKISNAEELIQDMLLKGEIFEIKPGRIKLM